MKTYKQSIITIFLGLLIITGISYAWTGPSTNPPDGNTDAPINVGARTQYKAGAFGVGGLFRTYSNAVFDGNVGIGTPDPQAKLDVNGVIKITDGTQCDGCVLTSDENGLAHWKKISETPIPIASNVLILETPSPSRTTYEYNAYSEQVRSIGGITSNWARAKVDPAITGGKVVKKIRARFGISEGYLYVRPVGSSNRADSSTYVGYGPNNSGANYEYDVALDANNEFEIYFNMIDAPTYGLNMYFLKILEE